MDGGVGKRLIEMYRAWYHGRDGASLPIDEIEARLEILD